MQLRISASSRRTRWKALALLACLYACFLSPIFAAAYDPVSFSPKERAEKFRSLGEQGELEAAAAMMAPDARRWWETREGLGQPWTLAPSTPGSWAAWDVHFRSQKEVVEWREGPSSATVVIRENNDYYRLLERPPALNEAVYFFDETGRISGLLIRGTGARAPGLTAQFVEWARVHAPSELAVLMPNGEIDPSGDHPQRFRRLLNRWRQATGRQTIELPHEG